MEWKSVLSRRGSVEQCLDECLSLLGDARGADLALVFVSSSFRQQMEPIPKRLRALEPRVTIGCTGGGVIGASQEVEQNPALSITLGWLPDAEISGFHLEVDELPDEDAPPEKWRELLGLSAPDCQFLLLADPFSFNLDSFLRGLDYAFPHASKLGGLASDARGPGGNRLILDSQIFSKGLVGVALSGNVAVDAVVSQGCRPIGQVFTITAGDRNLILELDHKPPLVCLEEVVRSLSPRDRRLAESSLFFGIRSPELDLDALLRGGATLPRRAGDFLIRNLIGADPKRGALAVGAQIRPGQEVQFHLRDARSSAQDLERLLDQYKRGLGQPQGAILFSCLGRGEYLYGEASHDSKMFQSRFPGVALGGFFCNGEIGPVGETTHLHGYTSCFALFREPS